MKLAMLLALLQKLNNFITYSKNGIDMKRNSLLTLLFLGASTLTYAQKQVNILQVPGVDRYAKIDSAGTSVLASGRFITPAGKTIRVRTILLVWPYRPMVKRQ
jgi:hypothetical protein